ncbi:MAG: FAD-binding oxidoreductase [Crocinitomicaceae bacterium]|nr:FAD-binding oxidoreductase [Crocinitomicaceae bacterium]
MKKILVVGGGIAGSCLSYQLAKRNCVVTLMDSGTNVSTKVAGGVIIPLVFRRMTKSWRIDDFLPYAKSFYQQLEDGFDTTILYPMPLRRFFSSLQERNYWLTRQHSDEFSNYMSPISEEDESVFPYANKFGSGRVKECYRVDAESLLNALKIKSSFQLIQETVDYSQINAEKGSYKNEVYDCIVFCEGYQANDNPWFNYLPVDPTKGEVLTVKVDGLSETEVLNRKCSAAFVGNGAYKVGATYVWHTANTIITEEGKQELLDHLNCLTEHPATVVDQVAGIRPTTIDRRPLMGFHPEHNKLAVFNGLGAKGFLLAPLLSEEMSAYLLDNKVLDKECVLTRLKTTSAN